MKVVLAEKKIQAEELMKPFPHKKAQGYIDIMPCAVFPNGGVCVWASGHLISLQDPEYYDKKLEKWNLQDLPIIPQKFKYKVDRTKSSLFSTIKRFVNDPRVKEVILATDPAREGELVGGLVLLHANNRKPVKRLWTSSLAKNAVEHAFNNLLPESAKKNLFYEAYSRQCADWIVGMNTTRLYTILLKNKGHSFEGTFSTGRVQTPLLSLIVEREKVIENFVSTPYWQVLATFNVDGKKFKGKWFKDSLTNLPNNKLSLDLVRACQDKPVEIRDLKKEQKQFAPPLLHNLSSLQTTVNKKFRYSPSETLDIVQKMYERGIVSYPRSDSQYVTRDEAVSFPIILEKVSQLNEYTNYFPVPVTNILDNKRYVNPEKVSDHYAIIPTENVPKLSDLDEKERNVYDVIVRSLIAAHCENSIIDFTTVITYVDGKFSFSSKGKITIQDGWRKVIFHLADRDEDEENEDNQCLPVLSIGERGTTIDVVSKEGKTKPPKRYTEGDLIALMKNAGKNLENVEIEKILHNIDGLGTEATRAGMIAKLKQQKYIEIKKNIVYSTDKGRFLINAIGSSILTSAELTGQWEKRLREIGSGKLNSNAFIEDVKSLTLRLVQEGYVSVNHITKQPLESKLNSTESTETASANANRQETLISNRKHQTATENHKEATQSKSQLEKPASVSETNNRNNHDQIKDEIYKRAVLEVVTSRNASISLLQRKQIGGYSDCAKMIERMERENIVGKYNGQMPREILINIDEMIQRFPGLKILLARTEGTKIEKKDMTTEREAINEDSSQVNQYTASLSQDNHPYSGGHSEANNQSKNSYMTFDQAQEGERFSHALKPQRAALNMNDLGYCPKCNSALIVDKGNFYGCNAYKKSGCTFTISKQILGVEILKEDIQALLNRGETELKKGFKKNNEYFDANIVLKQDGKIEFKAPEPRALQIPTNLLKTQPNNNAVEDNSQEIEWIETATEMIKMPAKVKKVSYGPKVVRYELLPESLKINISNYRRYKDNFQAALQAEKITLYSPIPGSNHVGIEVPNKSPYVVYLKSLLDNREFMACRNALTFPIGVDMLGNPVFADLAEMPHVLIAGATGAGKSVFINSFIISLLYGQGPDNLRFVMIDPKKVELSVYSKLPHLFCPIIIEPAKAVRALKKLTTEMDKRYEKFLDAGVRNIQSYNEYISQNDPRAPKLPYIVLIIDELADLMMTAPGDVEHEIQRLSQMARAAGIHMVIATQRPTKQFLSPNIKGNLPVRIAFAVAAGNDSLVILDESGAEDLLGKGDMFFKPKDGPKQRLVSSYVTDEEIERVVSYVVQKYGRS